MAGSTYGTIFQISTWGESHGKALGVVIDGCPAGLALCEEDIQKFLDRRKPGQSVYTTQRKEADEVEILSGVFEGVTTGTPISLMVKNTDQHSKDYDALKEVYRPGHADYTFDKKYGIRDHRGGGRSSGRETIGRVAAGAVAAKILAELGIRFTTYVSEVGPIESDPKNFDASFILENPLCMADKVAYERAAVFLDKCRRQKDSCGGIVTCLVDGVPAGLGDPVFEKLDANLAKAIFSIGAVKGFEIGEGMRAAKRSGVENNDAFVAQNGQIRLKTNHSGGILGGISSGEQIVLRAAFKPTPSVASAQESVKSDNTSVTLEIEGRHDPIIAPRAAVVVESMSAITILDALLKNKGVRMEDLRG